MSDWSPLLTTTKSRAENPSHDQRARNDEAGAALLAMSTQSFANMLDDRIGSRSEEPERYRQPAEHTRTEERTRAGSSDQHRPSQRSEGTKVKGQQGNTDQPQSAQDSKATTKAEHQDELKAEKTETEESTEPTSGKSDQAVQELNGVTGHQGSMQNTAPAGATGSAVVGPAGAIRLAEGWRTIQSMAQLAKTETAAEQNQQPAQIRSQVLQAMQQMEGLSDGKGVIKLQLDPAHLGKIEVTIQRKGQQLEVTFKVESAAAEQALRERSSELGQAILGKGTSWNNVNVTIELESDEESEDMPDTSDEQTQPQNDEDSAQNETSPESMEGEGQWMSAQ